MNFDAPLGHRPLVERLWSAAARGRLPHALLFDGPDGIGKFAAARWFTAGLLCERAPGEPCGTCGRCKRLRSDNHADVLVIDPIESGEDLIRVGRIAARDNDGADANGASLEEFLDLRAVEGEVRVVLIRECHRMNTQAQNALLKTLEEPRAGTLLLLETARAARLLPTILSRCIRVRFEALSDEDCRALLAELPLGDGADAERLARWTERSPGRALAWSRRGAPAIRAAFERVLAGGSPLPIAANLWELDGEFAGAQPAARARNRARFVLDLALQVARDARRLASGVDADELAHGDLEGLDALARRVGNGMGASGVFDVLLQCRADIDRNLAPEPVVERALLALAGRAPILTSA